MKEHQQGKGAKYTRSHLPVELVYSGEVENRSEALRREAAVKRLRRNEKLALIEMKRGSEETGTPGAANDSANK